MHRKGRFRVNDDILAASLPLAAGLLDITRRTWIIDIANLVDVSLEAPALSEQQVRTVIEITSATAEFPSGPITYAGSGYDVRMEESHREVTLAGSQGAPNLEMKLGLGEGGFIAVALTRSDVFDDRSEHVGGVPLADIESVIADTFTLAIGTSLGQNYFGPINFAFGIYDDRPGVDLVGYVIDDDTGALVPAPIQEGFRLVTGSTRFDETMTPQSAHEDVHRMAAEALAQFGALPQLTSLLDHDNDSYANPLLHDDPTASEVWGAVDPAST